MTIGVKIHLVRNILYVTVQRLKIRTFNRSLSKSTTRTIEVFIGIYHNTSIVHIMPGRPLKQNASTDVHRPMSDIILNGNYYAEMKGSIISGEKCMLINAEDKEYIWLATNKGYGLMKPIERCSNTNITLFVMETQQLKNIAKEIWVSSVFAIKRYDERSNELHEERQVRIFKCETGVVFQESVFTPKKSSGTIIYIAENENVHMSGCGKDMLDNVSKYARNYNGYINTEYYFFYASLLRVLIALTFGIGTGILLNNTVKCRFKARHRIHSFQLE